MAGGGGAVAGGVIGGLAGWPGWLDLVAAVGLGRAGVTGMLAWYRSRIRNRRLSWRIFADDPAAPALIAALAVLMKLTTFLELYDADMKDEAAQQRVPVMPLGAHTRQVPAAIHQALWELRTETTRDTGETVLAAARAAAAAAVTDVHDTWRAFDSFLPAALSSDPEPTIVPTANPAKDLQDLAAELHQEQQARRLAIDDVHQINARNAPQ